MSLKYLELYLSQTPKFLTLRGFFSTISSTLTISPVVFLNLRSWRRKYQNLEAVKIHYSRRLE